MKIVEKIVVEDYLLEKFVNEQIKDKKYNKKVSNSNTDKINIILYCNAQSRLVWFKKEKYTCMVYAISSFL